MISNTLPVPDDASHLGKLTVLSIGSLLAGAIDAIFNDTSVSELFPRRKHVAESDPRPASLGQPVP